jgi:hypothetical protein
VQEVWFACLRLGQLELASEVDLAVVGDNPAALAESHHSLEMAQEGSLAQVQETIQAVVDHMALAESRLGREDHHDPIHLEDLEDPEGRMSVDIVDDVRKEVHLEVKDLVVADQEEGLVADAAEELGVEVEGEIRSVCKNLLAN